MFHPKGTNVLIKIDSVDEVTQGGIIIPEVVRDRQQFAVSRGRIVELGPDASVHWLDKKGVKISAEIGDRCVFVKYAGFEIRMGEKRELYRVVSDLDIMGQLDSEEKEMPDSRKSMVK